MVVHGPYPLTEPRVAREARAALGAGFEVDVLAMRQPGEPWTETIDGATVHRLPYLRRARSGPGSLLYEYVGFTLLAIVVTALLHLRRRYAVIHVHNPPDFLVVAALLPRLAGARVVFDVHDLAPELFELRLGRRRGAGGILRLLRRMERWALTIADAVVTVHEPYRRELLARGVADRKIVVVANSLDERLVPAGSPRPSSRFRAVYHGTVSRHYGLDVLLEALARVARDVPDAHLEIYGVGDGLPALRRRADELGLGDRVEVTGPLPQADVLAKVQRATVGVVPTLALERNKAALPTKLLEYVALRVPVVASDLPAVREHFSGDEVRFVPAGDPDALATALIEVARDPAGAAARAEAAFGRARGYRWQISATRYERLLDRLAATDADRHVSEPREDAAV